MKLKERIILGIIVISMILVFYFIGFNKRDITPKNVYQVYLNGEVIGLVDNKEELLNKINEEQQDIKDTYGVSKVYPPNGFDIKEYVTYDEDVTSAEDIYEKIKSEGDFTVEGYLITITKPKTENQDEKVTTIEVLNDQVYYDAENKFITTFVDASAYQNYINSTQPEIKDVGSIIKHMSFEETVTVKQAYISVKDKIFTNATDLTQYLLYGTTVPSKTYTVKQGDTLASIANASKLNVRELLIANPKYREENSVLAIGDTLSNSVISPVLNLVEEVRSTDDVEQVYSKKTVEDDSMSYNTSVVTQAGVTGINRVTQEYRIINGERTQDTYLINSVTLRAPVEEITSVGPSYSSNSWSGGTGGTISTGLDWTWPTNSGYIITTDYEYRWGSFHNAIDISGAGNCGSPIYASRAGTVVQVNTGCANTGWYGSMCGDSYGNYVLIEHENNYYTLYAHLLTSVQVSSGQSVSRGQIVGYMGSSGSSTGCHLHFGFAVGNPFAGGTWHSPWSLF